MDCPLTVKELKILCKHEGLKCTGTKAVLCDRVVTYLKKLNIQEKYLTGLTDKERVKRIAEIRINMRKTDPSAYKFSTDFTVGGTRRKTKKSTYTTAFFDRYPNAKSLEDKAKATGVPLDILKKVYNKGLSAYRTGHRPGATPEQWGYARVHSFLMKGCTYYSPDHKLVEEAKERSTKAKRHWSSLKCICSKRC